MAAAVRQSLADRLMQLDGLIDKENQLPQGAVTPTDTYAFVESMKNANTQSKTKSDVSKVCQWLLEIDEIRQPEDIPPGELDMFLARMLLTFKKKSGEEYEPDSLKSIVNSLSRYLTSKNYPVNISTDNSFNHSRLVLSSKRKSLKQMGLGNKKNRADPFTDEELEILRQKSLLGEDNPEALINTVWLNNTLHFGLRGRQEHVDMLLGDFETASTASGRQYIMFTERATKTRNGVVTDPRKFMPKMFEQPGDPNCPVKTFRAYEAKRPQEMSGKDSRFYLGINQHYDRPGAQWFLPKPMGKNSIGNIAKRMSDKADMKARHVNHSGRKTCVSKLLDSNCHPTEVVQLTGHKNLLSLNAYNTVSVDKQIHMSSLLHSRSKNSVSSVSRQINTSYPADARPLASFSDEYF